VDPLVVVGLGNPGPEYAGTRHNVGFEVLDRVAAAVAAVPFETTRSYAARRGRVPGEAGPELVLLAPLTYMNLSGDAVVEFDARHGLSPERMLVVVDDVYLPLGQLRLRTGGSDGGHNGLASIAASVGTTAYARLRVGVGRGDEETRLRDHVLSGFRADEEPLKDEALRTACAAALAWATEGAIPAMNRFNRAPEGER
jgi:PTH1 family peptidyl-tRNA hydrolase